MYLLSYANCESLNDERGDEKIQWPLVCACVCVVLDLLRYICYLKWLNFEVFEIRQE